MAKSRAKKEKFFDLLGREWPSSLGNLSLGCTFVLYGTEVCVVKDVDQAIGPASVVYTWKGKDYVGLPPIRKGQSWHAEET